MRLRNPPAAAKKANKGVSILTKNAAPRGIWNPIACLISRAFARTSFASPGRSFKGCDASAPPAWAEPVSTSSARCAARSSRVFTTTQSSKLWKFRDATKSSRRALNLAPIRHGYCRCCIRRGLSMASKRTETAIEKIIAACDGNIHGALEALLLVNEYLEDELHRLYAGCLSLRKSTCRHGSLIGAAFRDPDLRCGWRGRRLPNAAFADTCQALGRIDFAPRLRWPLDLLQPSAITGGADNFRRSFTRLFHCDQSLRQDEKLKFIRVKIAAR